MRSRLLLLTAASLFVVGGYFLFRGEARDDHQDERTAKIAESTEQLAQGTAQVAQATEQLGGAVRNLSANARKDEARISALESETSQLKERVQAVEEFIPEREKAIAYTFITSDFAIAGNVKLGVAEAFMTNGTAPGSNAEAGLPTATDLRGQSLRATYVRSGGQIIMEYDAQSGVDGGVIKLIPDIKLAMRSGIINWRCETSDFEDIQTFMPACQYVSR